MFDYKPKEKIVIKNFNNIRDLIKIFPARNLKANYFVLREGERVGMRKTKNEEVWGIVQGIAQVQIHDEVFTLRKNQLIRVPKGCYRDIFNQNKIILRCVLILSKNGV